MSETNVGWTGDKTRNPNAEPAPVGDSLASGDCFASRHIGPDAREARAMLEVCGFDSMEALMGQTVPESIRLRRRSSFRRRAARPKPWRSFVSWRPGIRSGAPISAWVIPSA